MKNIFFSFLLLTGIATAQQWTKLGDVTVTGKFDNESIILSGKDNPRQIKFRSLNTAIQINAIDLYYSSGEVQNLDKKLSIDNGKESESIPVKNAQALKKVVFYYKMFAGKGNEEALIELYGSK